MMNDITNLCLERTSKIQELESIIGGITNVELKISRLEEALQSFKVQETLLHQAKVDHEKQIQSIDQELIRVVNESSELLKSKIKARTCADTTPRKQTKV